MPTLEDAIANAGGRVALATALGVTRQAVYNWVCQGWVPLGRAEAVERLSGVGREHFIKPEFRELLASRR